MNQPKATENCSKALKSMYNFRLHKSSLETYFISQNFHFRFFKYLILLTIRKGSQINATNNSPYYYFNFIIEQKLFVTPTLL